MAVQKQVFEDRINGLEAKITIIEAIRVCLYKKVADSTDDAPYRDWQFEEPPFEEGATFLIRWYGRGRYKHQQVFLDDGSERHELYKLEEGSSDAEDPWQLICWKVI